MNLTFEDVAVQLSHEILQDPARTQRAVVMAVVAEKMLRDKIRIGDTNIEGIVNALTDMLWEGAAR